MTPPGRLEGGRVLVVAPHGARLYARHLVGTLESNGTLSLSIPEAAWCVSGDRLAVELSQAAANSAKSGAPTESATVGELLRQAKDGANTAVTYLVYNDLRERGLIVRHDPAEPGLLDVWPRGAGNEGAPEYKIRPLSERVPIPPVSLWDLALRHIVAAVVDEDGAVTHYKLERELPAGATAIQAAALGKGTGRMLADRVLVEDPATASRLWSATFAGQRLGTTLALSLTEAAWLSNLGALTIDGGDPHLAGTNLQPRFAAILQVYTALRAAGIVPKSGFKFGTHLRGYRGDPDGTHAEWLIDCLDDGVVPWAPLARATRVAHGVRKKIVLARVSGGVTSLVSLAWFRP